jgi:hypothetical protein
MTIKKQKEREEAIKREKQAVMAMQCDGCPYRGEPGSTALLSYDEQCERFRNAWGRRATLSTRGF